MSIVPPTNRAGALLAFCRKIGISADAVKGGEGRTELRLETEVLAGSVAGAAEPDYQDLIAAFGTSLDLEVRMGAAAPIDIRQGQALAPSARGIADIAALPPTTHLQLVLVVQKAPVLDQIGLDQATHNGFFYLFADNLAGLLSAPLIRLDELVAEKPAAIIVSDADLHFSGELLTIVGEPSLAHIIPALKPPAAPTLEHAAQYLAAALETPSLIGARLTHLTPLHFVGQWVKKGSQRIESALAGHLLDLCILYSANRSTFNADQQPVESVYNSPERTATLNLAAAPTGPIQVGPLESLAKWLYSGRGTDQRLVLQNVVARELYSDDPVASYNGFNTRLSHILDEARWHYQVFVDGKITKHFEEVQKVIGYVAEVNKKISEALDSVTKSLTDALLATVGVLVLSVLAALVKKDASIAVFRISMEVYAVYLVFYALYRMASIFYSYVLLGREAKGQLGEYAGALGDDKRINELSFPLTRRKIQFHILFWLTFVLYVVFAIMIWKAGIRGPEILIDRGIISAP